MVVKDLEYKVAQLGLMSGLIGYALSFYSVYLFHLIIIIFLIYVFFINRELSVRTLKIILPIIIFFLYSAFTLFWVRNLELGLVNLFYILCGLFAVVFSVICSKDEYKLQKTYKLIVVLAAINFLIGFFESLGFFRLPMSPYSAYASFFGYKASDLSGFYAYQVDSILSRPTGFNGNPNTFGFVFIITFPFLFFYNNLLKCISLVLLVFFNFYLQSRGVFIATILFFLIYFIFNFKKIFIYFIGLVFLIFIFPHFLNYDFDSLRISSSFNSVGVGVNNIIDNNINLYSNSTDVRSSIYALGIMNLLNNPFFGLGLGGVQSVLIDINSPIQSFHFYFLEILINYGIVFYIFFLLFYIGLVFKILIIGKKINNVKYKKIVLSVFYSLAIMPFASIAPSSIVYNLTAWIVVGLALSIVFLEKEGKLNEK